MKFEHLLKIYWIKGLFYNGKLHRLDWTLKEMFTNLAGLSNKTKMNFTSRFELTYHLKNKNQIVYSFTNITVEKRKVINMYIAQLTNINFHIKTLTRYNLIRLYLIKSFRGRAQALGKPSRGQRTWSNAWTAHKYNKTLRSFVNDVLKYDKTPKAIQQLNFKVLKKKFKKKIFKVKPLKIEKKKNLWF